MRVLLIDGPRAGARYDIPDNQRTLLLPIPVDEDESNPVAPRLPWEVTFKQVMYTIHRGAVWMGDRSINVGSVASGALSLEDLIEVVLSDEAKEALT